MKHDVKKNSPRPILAKWIIIPVLSIFVIYGMFHFVGLYSSSSGYHSSKSLTFDSASSHESEINLAQDGDYGGVERPIKMAFFHDPNSEYGTAGSPLLVSSIMKFSQEPEHMYFHIIIESEETLNATEHFAESIRQKYPAMKKGTGGIEIHVRKITDEFETFYDRVKGKSSFCRRKKILMHHFALPYTFPKHVGKVIMLDTDMIVKSDIAELWDMTSPQLNDNAIVAAHKNCKQIYSRYFNSLSGKVIPDKKFASNPEQCTYDNGIVVINTAAPKFRSMLTDAIAMVMDNAIFKNMHFVACTRDMMNLLFYDNYAKVTIPDEWMLGGACYKPDGLVKRTKLIHFSGNRKVWRAGCQSRIMVKLAREICKDPDHLDCEPDYLN